MCTVLAAAISPFGMRIISIILTTAIWSILKAGALMNTSLRSAREILIGAMQSIAPLDTRRQLDMARAAAMRLFPTATILIIWSMDACTTRMAIIATTTVH